MSTGQDIYEGTVRQLPPKERLRLASLILNRLSELSDAQRDFSDASSDEDVTDLTAFALRHAEQAEGETDSAAPIISSI